MSEVDQKTSQILPYILVALLAATVGVVIYGLGMTSLGVVTYSQTQREAVLAAEEVLPPLPPEPVVPLWPAELDIPTYDQRLLALTRYVPPPPIIATTTKSDGTIATTTKEVSDLIYASSTNVTVDGAIWPTAASYPHGGAILPFKRIVAYYGNFYSRQMGILGEYDQEIVLAHLASTTREWEAADPDTPVLPAIEYIAMVAQAAAGADGMYRAAMPDREIDKALAMARQIKGIMILDLQVGKSAIEVELPQFRQYLERPDVHLAIDPEFSMKYGNPPGTVVGTYDATDINYVINYLTEIVQEKQLPPKVLVVHRFTEDMVTNYQAIKPTPEVQVVIDMDGWGPKWLKQGTYTHVIRPEPVQFTGVKLFYKNDLKPPSTGLLSPQEVLELTPQPIYIQYQ